MPTTMKTDSGLPHSVSDLIPHRAGMQLIDALTFFSEDDGTATLEIRASNLFVKNDGELDTIVYIELLAQTAAAHSGYKARFGKGNPKFGFLVGAKDFKTMGRVVHGQHLTLKIHRDFQMENVTFLDGQVVCGNEVLAQGVLKLWEMPAMEVMPRARVSPAQNQPPFLAFDESQKTIISSSELNQKLIKHCTDFRNSTEQNTAEADFYYSDDFIGFEGHFPDNPIVPGVLMLKTGLLLAELAAGVSRRIANIKSAKFAKTVLPNEGIVYSLSARDNQLRIQIKSQDSLCAKFTLEIE